MKTTTILTTAAAAALVSCENPADKTTTATTGEAVEVEATTTEGGTKYVFTDASAIGFIGSKVTGSHEGGFKSFTGHFHVADGAPVGNDHQVVIDMNSTWSDNDKLTGHLKNADFFNVEEFPESRFEVTGLEKTSDGAYSISGNFTLHGQTKNITFPASVSQDGETVKIAAEFDINRQDFGISYAGKKDDLIRDEVVIKLDLHAAPEGEAGPQA